MSVTTLRVKHAALRGGFTERSRRLRAATEARALGYGGIAEVARATGLHPATISRGLVEYVEADLVMKERALQAVQSPSLKGARYRPTDRLLAFLDGL